MELEIQQVMTWDTDKNVNQLIGSQSFPFRHLISDDNMG
jgi:hypothetical protein